MKRLLMTAVIMALAVSAQGQKAEHGEWRAAGTDIVDHSVTIEGVGAVRAYADKCRLEFGIFADAGTAESALAGLKASREAFASAIAGVLGTTPEFTYDMPKAVRALHEGRPVSAAQTVSFRLDYISKDDQNVRDLIGKLTAAAYASGTVASGAEWPKTVFEVSQPGAFEDRLVSMAVANAKERAPKVARALGKRAGDIRAAGAPKTVSADGREFMLDGYTPIESDTPEVDIVYTVQVAFALEP